MMIGMTKPLRRFRVTRAAEDGELTDSDGEEEEGQIKREKGDDVALVADVGESVAAGRLTLFCLHELGGKTREDRLSPRWRAGWSRCWLIIKGRISALDR